MQSGAFQHLEAGIQLYLLKKPGKRQLPLREVGVHIRDSLSAAFQHLEMGVHIRNFHIRNSDTRYYRYHSLSSLRLVVACFKARPVRCNEHKKALRYAGLWR